jgi:hypothetical protein
MGENVALLKHGFELGLVTQEEVEPQLWSLPQFKAGPRNQRKREVTAYLRDEQVAAVIRALHEAPKSNRDDYFWSP